MIILEYDPSDYKNGTHQRKKLPKRKQKQTNKTPSYTRRTILMCT